MLSTSAPRPPWWSRRQPLGLCWPLPSGKRSAASRPSRAPHPAHDSFLSVAIVPLTSRIRYLLTPRDSASAHLLSVPESNLDAKAFPRAPDADAGREGHVNTATIRPGR